MQFNVTVQREVDNQIEQWKHTVLASVMLLSQQDAKFKQTLLAALQGEETIPVDVDVEER